MEIYLLIHVKSWREHKVLRMRLSIQFWFKGTGCWENEFPQILDSLRPKSGRPLSWTHYRILLQETSPEARAWYAEEAQEQAWSVRTLQRNISSQYYYRMLMSQNAEPVEKNERTDCFLSG